MLRLNEVKVTGSLVKDPELLYTPKGKKYLIMRLAVNHYYKTESGEQNKETVFINAKAWGKLAEIGEKYLVKGRTIYLNGRLAQREWVDKNKECRSDIYIVVDDFQFMDTKRVEETETIINKEPIKEVKSEIEDVVNEVFDEKKEEPKIAN